MCGTKRKMNGLLFLFLITVVRSQSDTSDEKYMRVNGRPKIVKEYRDLHLIPPAPPPGVSSIYGGTSADISDYPYQLSLRREGDHLCGASIIDGKWALTAGHCCFMSASEIVLQAGSSNKFFGGDLYYVSYLVKHPKFDEYSYDYDLCLLRINGTFRGKNTAPVKLVSASRDFPPGTQLTVSGWGRTPEETSSTYFQEVSIPLVDHYMCNQKWGGVVSPNHICAGEENRDSCNGDSGGPLVTSGMQIGIVSWGSLNCGGSLPGLYTRISKPEIRNFIRKYTGI